MIASRQKLCRSIRRLREILNARCGEYRAGTFDKTKEILKPYNPRSLSQILRDVESYRSFRDAHHALIASMDDESKSYGEPITSICCRRAAKEEKFMSKREYRRFTAEPKLGFYARQISLA